MRKKTTAQDRRKAFRLKSKKILTIKSNNDLAKQVSDLYLGIELTTEKVMKTQNTDKNYLEFMQEINKDFTQEDLDQYQKTLTGEPIVAAWYLQNEKFKKSDYNKLKAVIRINPATFIYDTVIEQIEEVFYNSFERIIANGQEVDLADIDVATMQSYITAFITHFDDALLEFKKK